MSHEPECPFRTEPVLYDCVCEYIKTAYDRGLYNAQVAVDRLDGRYKVFGDSETWTEYYEGRHDMQVEACDAIEALKENNYE